MKYFFIALLCTSIVLLSHIYAAKYKWRVKRLESFRQFLVFAKSEVTYVSTPVLEIVKKYDKLYTGSLPFLNPLKEPVAACVKENLQREEALDTKQKQMICDFFAGFGTQDEEASVRLLEHYRAMADSELQAAAPECREKRKLIHRLSLLGALGVAILLI